jgi:predicted DCC family thiol-disulfide oxidoreductase YuxK
MLNNTETGHPIVLYDGDCGLCNRWVQFVLKRDRRQLFRFASLQSETARELLREHGVSPRMDTVVLLDQGHVYLFSQAILQILRRLGRGWQLLYALSIVPPGIRDTVYRWIARNRHRFFKGSPSCLILLPEWRERFLDLDNEKGNMTD